MSDRQWELTLVSTAVTPKNEIYFLMLIMIISLPDTLYIVRVNMQCKESILSTIYHKMNWIMT